MRIIFLHKKILTCYCADITEDDNRQEYVSKVGVLDVRLDPRNLRIFLYPIESEPQKVSVVHVVDNEHWNQVQQCVT